MALGLLIILIEVVVLIIVSGWVQKGMITPSYQYWVSELLGGMVLGGALAGVIGLALGIIGARNKKTNMLHPALGILLNSFVVILQGIMILVGWSVARQHHFHL